MRPGPRRRSPGLSLGQATLASVTVDVIGGLATIAATPRLVHALGAAAYGVIGLLSVLAGQLGVLQLGVGPAATRLVAECRGQGDPRRREAMVRAALLLALLATVALALIFMACARRSLAGALRTSPALLSEALRAVPAALVVVAVQPLLGALQGVLQGDERFGWSALCRLAYGLFRPSAAVLAVSLGGGVPEVLAAQGAHDVLLMLGCAVLVLRQPADAAPRRAPSQGEVLRAARSLVGLGVQFACLGAVVALLLDAEKLAIGLARSAADFTYYTVPYGAILRIASLGGALGAVLLPRLSFAAEARDPDLIGLVAQANRLTLAVMTGVLTMLLVVTPELLRLWLGAEFAAHAARPTRILLCAMAANAAGLIPGTVLRARARPWNIVLLYGLQIPVHLLVVYALVRRAGIVGAALAWGLRAVLDTLAERALAQRALGARLSTFTATFGPSLLLAGLGLLCEGTALPLLARILGGLALSVGVLAWLLRAEDLQALARVARVGR